MYWKNPVTEVVTAATSGLKLMASLYCFITLVQNITIRIRMEAGNALCIAEK